MGLLTNLIKTAVNVAILPVAAVVDGIEVLDGDNSPSKTLKSVKNIKDGAKDSLDDLL